MSKIAIHIGHPLVDGEQITFRAPCASADATGLRIYSPISTEDNTETSAVYNLKDAGGDIVDGETGLFASGAYVTVALDTTNAIAYIYNARSIYPAEFVDMTGATASAAGKHGLVPAPAAGEATRYLRSDGTWHIPPDNNTWNANSLNTAGYVAAPTSSRPRYFYATDNSGVPAWRQNITVVGASSSANGTAGLVPAPTSANYANRAFMYLRSDGGWQYLPLANNTTTTAEHYALDARMGKTLDGEIAVRFSVFSDTTNGLKVGSTLHLPSISFNMINSLSICNVMSSSRMFVMTGGVISTSFRFSGTYMDASGANPVAVGMDIEFNLSTKKVTKITKSSNWPSSASNVAQLELFILRKTLS